MNPLRQALGSAFPVAGMDSETVASITRAMRRIEKREKAEVISQPMRNLFDLLATGEAYEIEGRVVMEMPDIDAKFAERAEWCEVSPAIEGWIDCWRRLAPDISTKRMKIIAERLRDDKPITPRLVEQSREEFEATVGRLEYLEDGVISSAILTTQLAWELEKVKESA